MCCCCWQITFSYCSNLLSNSWIDFSCLGFISFCSFWMLSMSLNMALLSSSCGGGGGSAVVVTVAGVAVVVAAVLVGVVVTVFWFVAVVVAAVGLVPSESR